MDFAKLATQQAVHTPCTGTAVDALGNDVPAYGAPETVAVYSWSDAVEVTREGYTARGTWDVNLTMPAHQVGKLDKLTVGGQDYIVDGVRDMSNGFHGWKPGIVVELKRVTG